MLVEGRLWWGVGRPARMAHARAGPMPFDYLLAEYWLVLGFGVPTFAFGWLCGWWWCRHDRDGRDE